MQFLKKNYEKILLGLVLFGLVAAVAFLPFMVTSEKQDQEERRTKKFNFNVQPLPPLETNRYAAAVQQATQPLVPDLSTTNRLFNPVRWLKGPNGLIKVPPGGELEKLVVVSNITSLYLIVSLDSITASDSGVRYAITIEHQAAAKRNQPGKKTYYVSAGDKKKDAFTLREVKGPAEAPIALVLELSDGGEQISIAKDKPFRRVEDHSADLRCPSEGKSFPNRRANDPTSGKIVVGGEQYNVVVIDENEVVLSAPNGKKYTIRYNAAP